MSFEIMFGLIILSMLFDMNGSNFVCVCLLLGKEDIKEEKENT